MRERSSAQGPFGPPQVFAAAWNAGDREFTPGRKTVSLPPERLTTLGSGKLGTPWLRMHRANLSPFAVCCACWKPLAGGLGGRYRWHFARAPWYAGALNETPLTEIVWPLPWINILLLLKSGKFGTPLARMHLENASVEPADVELLPVDEFDPVDEFLVDEFEPHAAIVVAAASAAVAVSSQAGRNGRVRSRISSLRRRSGWLRKRTGLRDHG
jgi:hypothetical protein